MNPISAAQPVLLFGATGLVGGHVLEHLIADLAVLKIIVFVRNRIAVTSPKVEIVITDFKDLKEIAPYFNDAGILYCCLGTTMRKAKTKEAFKVVDYDLPVNLARLASKNEIRKFIVLSSLGADVDSTNFYLRTKGEMERDVGQFRFQKLGFLRPSFLLGHRKEFRIAERIMIVLMILILPFLRGKWKKYRPIHADAVAKAMINISNSLNNNRIYQSEELVWLGS